MVLSFAGDFAGRWRESLSGISPVMSQAVIDAISHDVPKLLTEIQRLGRPLQQRAADILAFFDRPGSSNGPTEAINGRLEHLRGTALGLQHLTHYIARSGRAH